MPDRYETILYEKAGAIATLTMNRPDRMNGITNRMVVEITKALRAVAAEARGGVVLDSRHRCALHPDGPPTDCACNCARDQSNAG